MKKSLLIAIISCLPFFLNAQTTVTFTTGGTQNFVLPAGITTISVDAWGAGGAGGGSTYPSNSAVRAGSGGGGGAFASTTLNGVPSGATLPVVVGVGGKGNIGQSGGAGGFSAITGYAIKADGGKGGPVMNTNNSPIAGGLGGTVAASTGTVRTPGGQGGNGLAGVTDEEGNVIGSGVGGNAANGGGTGGASLNTPLLTDNGNSGNPAGGGGSGGRTSFWTIILGSRKGGDGADGKVVIKYTCPTYSLTGASSSAVNVCSGTSSEITLTGDFLPVGLYSVSYEIQGIAQTPASMNVITSGTGTFIATGFTTVGTKFVKITSLTSGSSTVATENCTTPITPISVPVVVNSSGTAPIATAVTGGTCTQMTANWQAVSGAQYYELDLSTDSAFGSFVTGYNALNVGTVLTRTITGLGNGTYYYRVRAFNGTCSSSNSNTISYANPAKPAVPLTSSFGSAGIACTQFTATWGVVPDATSYSIEWFLSGSTTALGSATNITATNYTITNLTNLTFYRFRVSATNRCGTSNFSGQSSQIRTTGSVPIAVTGLGTNGVFCDSFILKWNTVANASSYLLDVLDDSTGSVVGIYNSYDIGNVLTIQINGLVADHTYRYRVRAKNGCGVGPYVEQTVKTVLVPPDLVGTITPSAISCTQFTISWAAVGGALNYTIQFSDDNSFPPAATQTFAGITATNYTFSSLTAGKTYYYQILSTNSCGSSAYNTASSAATLAVPTVPTITPVNSTICQTDGITLAVVSPNAAYTYVWSSGETTTSIYATSGGNYTVRAVSAGGCSSAMSAPATVAIDGLPTAVAGGSQTICSNGSATVSGASATNGNIKWTFSGGAGTLTNDTTLTPTFKPTQGGPARTIILTMTVSNPATNKCYPQIATAKYTVNVLAAPTVAITGSQSTCSDTAITVPAGAANASNGTIIWTHDGDGTITNATTLTPTYTPAAADAGSQVTLTLTVTASPACSPVYAVTEVYPVIVVANNTVGTASSSPTLCINTLMPNITHTTTGTSGIGVVTGLPNGVTASWASDVITVSGTPTEAGIFNYTIKLADGCGPAQATGTITVNALTASPNIGTVELPTCVNSQGSIELTGLPATAWSIAQNGTVSQTYSSSGSNYTISNLIPGNYSFTVQAGSNCPSLPTINVIIDAPVTNVWNGTVWSTGSPPIDTDAIEFNGDFQSTSDIEGCSCKINDGRNVTINSGNTLKIKHGLTVNSSAGAILTFENNASLVQEDDNAVNTGNINYKRTTTPVRRYDFTHWGCPVTRTPAFTLYDLSPKTLGDKYYKYDPNNGWVIIYGGNVAMDKGIGYIIRSPQDYDIEIPAVYNGTFIGVPNNGLVSVPISTAAKFYLIGNPYPSAVYADQFIVDNQTVMYGTLYYWTHNTPPRKMAPGDTTYKYTSDDYAIYNLSGSVLAGTLTGEGAESPGNKYAPEGYIASGQSIFVESKISGTAIFNNAMRVVGRNDKFFKSAQNKKLAEREKHRIWLNLANTEGAFKQILVAYADGATNNWDDNFDTKTMDSNKYIDFYSINESNNLSIQGKALPFIESEIIPLGYRSSIAGEFSIAIDHVDGIFKTQNIYLEDKKNNVVHDLRQSNYKFSTEVGTFTDRFVLRYTGKTLGTDDVTNLLNYVLCTVKDKIVRVKSSKEILKDVYVFDVSGKMLYSKNKIGETELQISNLQSNQVLMVKIILDNGATQTQKIIF